MKTPLEIRRAKLHAARSEYRDALQAELEYAREQNHAAGGSYYYAWLVEETKVLLAAVECGSGDLLREANEKAIRASDRFFQHRNEKAARRTNK